MAKKKVSNVVIKDDELIPTTLGVYSNKSKSSGIVFLVLAAFLAIAFFLPDIQKGVNTLLGKVTSSSSSSSNNNNNNNNNKPITPDNPDNPLPPDETDDKYSISPDTIMSLNSISVSNMNLVNGSLSLTIKSSEKVSLDQYYLELYDENNTLLKRIKISSETIDANTQKNYSFNAPSNASKISIVKKTINDYPQVNISYDDAGEGRMMCKSDQSEQYTYVFSNDELLKIVYTYNKASSDLDYSNVLDTFRSLDTFYKSIAGLSSTLISNENGFDYSLTINLNSVDSYDLDKINLDGKFKVKTSPKEIKFKLEANNYTCNI